MNRMNRKLALIFSTILFAMFFLPGIGEDPATDAREFIEGLSPYQRAYYANVMPQVFAYGAAPATATSAQKTALLAAAGGYGDAPSLAPADVPTSETIITAIDAPTTVTFILRRLEYTVTAIAVAAPDFQPVPDAVFYFSDSNVTIEGIHAFTAPHGANVTIGIRIPEGFRLEQIITDKEAQ